MLAAGAVGTLDPSVELAAVILGGSLAAGTNITKAGTRVLISHLLIGLPQSLRMSR